MATSRLSSSAACRLLRVARHLTRRRGLPLVPPGRRLPAACPPAPLLSIPRATCHHPAHAPIGVRVLVLDTARRRRLPLPHGGESVRGLVFDARRRRYLAPPPRMLPCAGSLSTPGAAAACTRARS
ncbi:hypothetical protein GGX14DRAFT_576458 [Mycena pura]|uniref:Uncharacterized protein n=1 Tax=Mycena pura TaxID=153505 RepID=A0AAD6UTR8_9AGAR|nr:hypothetical protein GGX14DRAFT_576458 [Mycena pura]